VTGLDKNQILSLPSDAMHHPGPPRFLAVGESVELAPRDPDPGATYRWSVADAPEGSRVALGDAPVERLEPDVPGVYRVELDAPDRVHRLTVRAFPADTAVDRPEGTSASGPRSGSGEETAGSAGVSGSGSRRGESDGHGGRPRVRLEGGRDGDTVRLRADARPHSDGDVAPGVEFYVDDRDPAAELTVEGNAATMAVPDAPVRIHAVPVADQYGVADAVQVHPDGSVERLYDPPAWADDATLYELFVRAFTPGAAERDLGAEIGEPGASVEGEDSAFGAIADRLDDIAALGVDTLWLTPVLEHDGAPHGYNVTDFFAIASDLGTREDYEALVEAAHDRGMRVLFDLVCNHSARDHPFFRAAVDDPDSEYRDWYDWRAEGEPETYFGWEHIANFDFDCLAVRRHLLDAVDEWAPLVDGFRCDMAWAVPDAFWREIRDRVKASDADFLMLDETIPYVAEFHEGMFDVHFDTTLYFTLRQIGRGHEPASAVLEAVEERSRVGFPDHAEFMLYLENHDETRYLEACGREATLAAAGALATLPGVPMLYAGQETGSLARRGPVDHGAVDEALYDHYRTLLSARKRVPALGDGHLERTDYRAARTGDVVAYVRSADGGSGDAGPDRVVVVLNFGTDPARVAVDEPARAHDLVTDAPVPADGDGYLVDDVVVLPAGDEP